MKTKLMYVLAAAFLLASCEKARLDQQVKELCGIDTLRSLAATGTAIRFGAGIAIVEELKSQFPQDGESGRCADAIQMATNSDNWRCAA